MSEIWEDTFTARRTMWGHAPSRSALLACDAFTRAGVRSVLVPGVGYGRNAKPFIDAGMDVTGIEISQTAIGLARSEMGLSFPIHHGSVTDMPFDDRIYDAVFGYGLLYLLDAAGRAKVIRASHAQLAPGGTMVFTVVSKEAPMYKQGTHLGDDWYEVHPGIPMFFYDAESIARELGPYGHVETTPIAEPHGAGATMPFLYVVCRKA